MIELWLEALIFRFNYIDISILLIMGLAYLGSWNYNLISKLILLSILLLVLISRNSIFDGIYIANYVKKNDEVIGPGTHESQKFVFRIKHSDYITFNFDKYNYDKKASRGIINCYKNTKEQYICVDPFFGTATQFNEKEYKSKQRTILYIQNK